MRAVPAPLQLAGEAAWTLQPGQYTHTGEGPKMSHLCCGLTEEENVSQISCLCISSLDDDVLTELYTD